VCALDTRPRDWTESDLAVLRALSEGIGRRVGHAQPIG
jgi:GAF domain-containing protein